MSRSRRQFEFLSRPWSFNLLEKAAPLARFRLVKSVVPMFNDRGLNVSVMPVNEEIQRQEETALPLQLLEGFIKEASHRVIVEFCACRRALGCRRYSADIGCLMMGDSALEIDPAVGHEVSVEEALAHVRTAADSGLVPFVGKARIDNLVFGIRNHRKLLSTCFCCECCCISRFARHLPAESRAVNLVRLEGLRVEVGEECDGCGACVKRCFLEEIEIVDGRAVIGRGCAGCGRCATVCKRGAITITLDDPAFIDEARARIGALVDYR